MGNTFELTLKAPKNELFDPLVLAPHGEINPDICDAIERFAECRDLRGHLTITIFSDCDGEPLQEKFRETSSSWV